MNKDKGLWTKDKGERTRDKKDKGLRTKYKGREKMEVRNSGFMESKAKNFALRIVRLYKFLIDVPKEFVMSKQVLRSGTSIGANIAEGTYAESNADIVHKYGIARKECNETAYWLELLHDAEYIDDVQFESIYTDCIELLKLLTAAIKTIRKTL